MALTGKLSADFSSFYDACKKAEVSLKGFQENSANVETSLNRVSNSLSGTRIMQQATIAAEAVERIGGASKLTDAELQRLGKVATEAAAKMTAMGVQVPAGVARLAGEFNGLSANIQAAGVSMGGMIASFISAQAILNGVEAAFRGVVDLVKEMGQVALQGAAVADVEENFKRLTDQVGILGERLMGTLRAGTHDTISNFELMKLVNQDLGAGLNLTTAQFGILTQGAFALAQATGVTVTSALQTMNDAMVTGRAKALALLTGKVNLEAAEMKYAASLGVSRANLTEAGKIEAARAGILDSVSAATARLGVQTDGLDERVAQASTAWANFKEDLGKAVATSKTLEAGMDGLKRALGDTFGGDRQALIEGLTRKIDDGLISLVGLGEAGVNTAGMLVKAFYAADKVFGDMAQSVSGDALVFEYLALGVAKFGAATSSGSEAAKRYAADVERIQGNIDALLTSMTARGAALQADDKAQASVDANTAKYVATLEALRAKMEAARAGSAALGIATTDNADAQGRATGAADTLGEALTKLTDAQQKALDRFNEGVADFDSIGKNANFLGENWRQTLAAMNPEVVRLAENFLKAGGSAETLGKVFIVTKSQTEALTKAAREQLSVLQEAHSKSIDAADEQLTHERAVFAEMEAHASKYTHGQLQEQLDKVHELELAMHHYGETAKDAHDKAAAAAQHQNDVEKLLNERVEALSNISIATNDKLIAQTQVLRDAYVDAWLKATAGTQAQVDKMQDLFNISKATADMVNRALGNTVEVNRGNLFTDQVGSGGKIGEIPKGDLLPYLLAGFSLQHAEDAIAGGLRPGDWKGDPGPRVPGFATGVENFTGGMAVVGERGPELLNLPRGSNVIPFDRGSIGGSVTINNTIHVTGVIDQTLIYDLTKKVSAEQVRSLERQGWRPSLSVRR